MPDANSTETIEIKFSPRKAVGLATLCAAFVALGVLILFVPPKTDGWREFYIGWSCIVFFGFGVFVAVWQISDTRPRLIINEAGIIDRSLDVGRIDWADIEAAYPQSILTNHFISLKLKNPEKYLRRTAKNKQKLASYNQTLGFETFNINLVGLRIKPAAAFALVAAGLLEHRAKNKSGNV